MNPCDFRWIRRRAQTRWTGWLALVAVPLASAASYLNHADLTAHLQRLSQQHPQVVRLEPLATSQQQRTVWRLEIGLGSDSERAARPALLVAAGLEGHDLAGTTLALAWVDQLLTRRTTNDALRQLLETTTVHVLPRLQVDAAEAYFRQPQLMRTSNDVPFDDDHDGLSDEDGPEDLNGDGWITQMRVEDPEGDHILDPEEPRLLVKADRAKGERGVWRLLPEGRDDDHDEAWNEDGLGGVNLNRNFPFGYAFFAPNSGVHPVSEPETRALADFVVSRPSIAVVFAFGTPDNLLQPPKAEPGGRRPPTAVNEDDLPILRELGKTWRDALGLKKELAGGSEPGAFHDWVYFHRGRLALAARPWSPAIQLERDKSRSTTTNSTPAPPPDRPLSRQPDVSSPQPPEAPDPASPAPAESASRRGPRSGAPTSPGPAGRETRNESDRPFLKWCDTNAPTAFAPWKSIEHPDFPGRRVEVGGFMPFAQLLPPEPLLDELAEASGTFLSDLAGRLPRVGIRKAEARPRGDSVYDLVIQVENRGYLPTALAQGRITEEVHPTRLMIHLEPEAFLAGARRTMLDPIPGSGGMIETRVTIRAKDRNTVAIEVISMLGGSVQTVIQLPQAP